MIGNPVCAFHGMTAEEHEHGRCLYCCLCFETLTPDECWADESGDRWDMCRDCGERDSRARYPARLSGEADHDE
ncbi:MAG: hypothetical protein NUW01_10395 [Gemmatimonadaceae bacterium]|nr:hypothetical protein [Gemmatimonadaceae bacterium]